MPRFSASLPGTEENAVINKALRTLFWISPLLNADLGKVEPPAEEKRKGLFAFANGVDWNPGGTGEGLYRYTGSAWVLVG